MKMDVSDVGMKTATQDNHSHERHNVTISPHHMSLHHLAIQERCAGESSATERRTVRQHFVH